MTKPRFE